MFLLSCSLKQKKENDEQQTHIHRRRSDLREFDYTSLGWKRFERRKPEQCHLAIPQEIPVRRTHSYQYTSRYWIPIGFLTDPIKLAPNIDTTNSPNLQRSLPNAYE